MKYFLSLILLLVSVIALGSNQRTVIPELVKGINVPVSMLCYVKITQACSNYRSPYHYFACLHHQMKQHFICRQNLAFFRETSGVIKEVSCTHHVDLVIADIMAADHSSEYFVVDHQGEIISPVANVNIQKAPEYSAIKKRFPNVSLWPIVVGSPRVETQKDGTQDIIFQQLLLNGCYRCERAGLAEIAYRFSPAGDFEGRALLRLIKQ